MGTYHVALLGRAPGPDENDWRACPASLELVPHVAALAGLESPCVVGDEVPRSDGLDVFWGEGGQGRGESAKEGESGEELHDEEGLWLTGWKRRVTRNSRSAVIFLFDPRWRGPLRFIYRDMALLASHPRDTQATLLLRLCREL